MLLEPDILLILGYNAFVNAALYAVLTITSNVFPTAYPFLNETDVGLCFLALGGGMIIGGLLTGKITDWEYRRVRDAILSSRGQSSEKMAVVLDEDFPLENARLRTMPIYIFVLASSIIGYGWIVDTKASIAGAVILMVLVGWMVIACMNSAQVLIMDLFPTQGSAITACNNLLRCTTGAGYVSFIDVLTRKVGTGWACVVVAGALIVFSPAVWLEMKMGARWRARRRMRRKEAEMKEVSQDLAKSN